MASKIVSRREFLRGAVVAGLGAAVAACAPKATAEATEAPAAPTEAPAAPTEAPAVPTEAPAADEPRTLTFMQWFDANWDVVPAGFSETGHDLFLEETGIDAQIEVVGYGDFNVVLKTKFAAGEPPDSFMVAWPVIRPWATEEFLVSLQDMAVAEWGDWEALFPEGITNEIKMLGATDGTGNTYFIPVYGQCLGLMWYNVPVFEQAGAEVPTTFLEWEDACSKLRDAGFAPIVTGGVDNWQNIDWFKALTEVVAPGRFMEFEAGNALLTDDDLVEIARTWRMMWEDGWFAPEVAGMDTGGATQMLFSDQAASFLGGTHMAGYANPASNPEIAPMLANFTTGPIPDGKGLVATAVGYNITSGSEHKDETWKFCAWWAAGTGQEIWGHRPEYIVNVNYEMTPVDGPGQETLLAPMMEQYLHGENIFRHVRCSHLYDAIGPTWQGVANGSVSPEIAMEDLQKVWDDSCEPEPELPELSL